MHLGIGARKQLALVVVQLQLDLQGARGGIECIGGAHRLGWVDPARVLRKMQFRLQSRGGGDRVSLGDLRIDAQLVRIGHPKQLGARGLAGVDEIADIGVACGHDAIERRNHPLEGLEILQPMHILRLPIRPWPPWPPHRRPSRPRPAWTPIGSSAVLPALIGAARQGSNLPARSPGRLSPD